MSYGFFYKHLISHLPDQFVENMGNYFYKLYIHANNEDIIELPVTIDGLKFANPVGMPSGWIDQPEKVSILHKLGAGVIIVKTITVQPKSGNPYPRLVRGTSGMINSLGLPNYGLRWWMENYQPKIHPSIISIKGSTVEEWTTLIQHLEKKTDIFELNFSCPNISDGIIDIAHSKEVIRDISSITSTPIFLKLSPEFSPQQNLAFVNSVRSDITGVSAINTQPVHHPRLGNPEKIGGLSGQPLYKTMLSHIQTFRQDYPTHSDLPIFASGGISDPQKAWFVFSNLQAFPLTLTTFLMRGPNVYQAYSQYIRANLENLGLTPSDILL